MISFQQQILKKGSNITNYSSTDTFTDTIGEYKTFYDNNAVTPYLPFNEVSITNNSTTLDIWFYKNQNPNAKVLIKANSSKVISDVPIDSFALFTKSGTAIAGDIQITLSRLPLTEDEALRSEIGNPLSKIKKLLPLGFLGSILR